MQNQRVYLNTNLLSVICVRHLTTSHGESTEANCILFLLRVQCLGYIVFGGIRHSMHHGSRSPQANMSYPGMDYSTVRGMC